MKIYGYQNMVKFIAVLFIIAKNLENTQKSMNRWMDQQIVIYAYKEMLHSNTDRQKKEARPNRVYISYDSIYMQF